MWKGKRNSSRGPVLCRSEQALQGAEELTDVEEPLSHGTLVILSKEMTGLDDHFRREHIGGCVPDGLEAGREEAGQWVRSLLSPSERRQKREFEFQQLEHMERGKCVICDSGKAEVMAKGIPRRH